MTRAALLIAVLGCAAWALWPLPDPVAPGPTPHGSGPRVHPQVAALDRAAFAAPIWVAPPPAPLPVAASVPPLRLQLIAILKDGDDYRAALYDPEADTLTVVGPGDSIAGHAIQKVAATSLELLDQGAVRTLSLRTEGSGR